jgi:hypothetical protein
MKNGYWFITVELSLEISRILLSWGTQLLSFKTTGPFHVWSSFAILWLVPKNVFSDNEFV